MTIKVLNLKYLSYIFLTFSRLVYKKKILQWKTASFTMQRDVHGGENHYMSLQTKKALMLLQIPARKNIQKMAQGHLVKASA